VEAALSDGVLSWEELVDAVFDDFEGRLEARSIRSRIATASGTTDGREGTR